MHGARGELMLCSARCRSVNGLQQPAAMRMWWDAAGVPLHHSQPHTAGSVDLPVVMTRGFKEEYMLSGSDTSVSSIAVRRPAWTMS